MKLNCLIRGGRGGGQQVTVFVVLVATAAAVHCAQKGVQCNEAHNFNWLLVEFNVQPLYLKQSCVGIIISAMR